MTLVQAHYLTTVEQNYVHESAVVSSPVVSGTEQLCVTMVEPAYLRTSATDCDDGWRIVCLGVRSKNKYTDLCQLNGVLASPSY